ncbi:MAG: acyltransferase [Candidatus Micrarchaeota archaeon]|nr:acyltransferase [Candidatus Micrarchaeota archaeon]
MRRLNKIKFNGTKNALNYWYKVKNPIKVIFNFIVIYIAKYLPSLALKRQLYRLIGIKIGNNVAVGLGVTFDIFFPELIEIGDNTIIGFNATILTHEFLQNEFRIGKVEIGKNVLIGANSTLLPGIKIMDNATISAMSLVNRDVKTNEFVGGVPIRRIKK